MKGSRVFNSSTASTTLTAAATIAGLFSTNDSHTLVKRQLDTFLNNAEDDEFNMDERAAPTAPILSHFNRRSQLAETPYAIKNESSTSLQFDYLRSNVTSNLLSINRTVFFDNFMYEKFIFYFVLCLISLNMTIETVLLFVRDLARKRELRRKQRAENCCSCCSCRKQSEAVHGSAASSRHSAKPDDESSGEDDSEHYSIGKVDHELKYTKQLLKENIPKPISFSKYLFEKYVYKARKDFRYSKQFINTHIIAFILLYYITCLIIRKSKLIMSVSSNLLLLLISFIFKMSSIKDNNFMLNSKSTLDKLIESLYENLSSYIITACLFSTVVYIVQLFIGIRRYQKNVLNAYKGKYVDIPAPKRFANAKLVSGSLHYSGYAIGYLLWGYLILFEVSLVMLIVLRFLVKFYFIAENLAKIILPVLTIFLFKRILIWYLCKYFMIRSKSQQKVFLKNSKLYFILSHFNFFFDCFLGSFVCSMRMIKSSLAALFFMPRLDYSIFGRYLEKSDLGFISYVTFIHMEVNQTHPVKLAACDAMLRSLRERHANEKKYFYKNKWLVAVSLARNPSLKNLRKRHIFLYGLMPRVESFEKFLERKVRNIFLNEGAKKKSRSTPCLLDLSDQSAPVTRRIANNADIKTSTIDYARATPRMVPPPPIPRRNIKNIYNMPPLPNIYNQISDSSVLTDQSTLDLNPNPHNHAGLGSNTSQSFFSNRSYHQ
jgi:hypothetical protein